MLNFCCTCSDCRYTCFLQYICTIYEIRMCVYRQTKWRRINMAAMTCLLTQANAYMCHTHRREISYRMWNKSTVTYSTFDTIFLNSGWILHQPKEWNDILTKERKGMRADGMKKWNDVVLLGEWMHNENWKFFDSRSRILLMYSILRRRCP